MTLLDLKPVEEISFAEVVSYWERSLYPSPLGVYPAYISPNKIYIAWVNETMQQVAMMWERTTGRIVQLNKSALYELFNKLGGWI